MKKISDLLRANLNEEQYNAAMDPFPEVLTLACAGSGKSRTLAYRIVRLLSEGSNPSSIVAFTFTEKAAESIKRRVSEALQNAGMSPTLLGAMYIGTIHSYCQHLLGKIDAKYRQFDVLDDNKLNLYLISRFYQLEFNKLTPRVTRRYKYFETIKQISDAWKITNDELLTIPKIINCDSELGEALQRLENGLEKDQFIDFSLMIRKIVDFLQEKKPEAINAIASLQHLMVDEYQDINPCQALLIQQLHSFSKTLFVVGDDDQAIYSWRGADVNNILNFEKIYPNCSSHTLGINFRSTEAIVQASDAFVKDTLGSTRKEKKPNAKNNKTPRDFRVLWFSTREDEARAVIDRIQGLLGTAYEDGGKVRGLTPSDFLILMRSTRTTEQNNLPRHTAFTGLLDESKIPYTLEAGGGPFDRPQVQVLRETFELLRNESPSRTIVETHFNEVILPFYPHADFNIITKVLTEWGRLIHTPTSGARRRVYPQQLVHELLNALNIAKTKFSDEIMRDIGVFSRMLQDIESVYMSVDSASRFKDVLNFLKNPAENGYDVSTDTTLQRPDAVTISTVHKAKGLEFPVVFVVDVENQRFPKRMRGYEGWLPQSLIEKALNRGAYKSTYEEEARLFYTAITRAERYLYVTGSARLPGASSQRKRKPSEYALRLNHNEISKDQNGLPEGLEQHPQYRRIDETIVPTSFSAIKNYLKCPKSYQFGQVFGFSPPITEMFGFGMTVHAAIAKLHERFPDKTPSLAEAKKIAEDIFHLKHVPQSNDPQNRPGAYENAKKESANIAQKYVDSYAPDFTQRREIEARFEIPAEGAVISGSIDLLLKEDDKGRLLNAHVIDFKALEGGKHPPNNAKLNWMELALQVQLYAKAAHEILGENAETGSVHLLKDNQRIQIPVTKEAIDAAIKNIEWAVQRIIEGDFPMRPHPNKCEECDFKMLCSRTSETFKKEFIPPTLHLPGSPEIKKHVSAFSECIS